MSKFKLIGLDLDGTTLNSERNISLRTRKALEKANKKGVHIVIATGRNFNALPGELRDLDFIEYTVNSNGGDVRNYKTGESIYRSCIDLKPAEKVYEFLKEKPYMIEVFVNGKGYINSKEFENIKNGEVPYRTVEYVTKTRTPVEDVFDIFKDNIESIENINIFFKNDVDKAKIKKELGAIKNICVTSSLKENLEIGGENTSKASGILFLAEKFGIDQSEIICFGDGLNDLEMIIMAGIGVAMENGLEEVKEKADLIAPSNDLDGVAQIVEKYVLNG